MGLLSNKISIDELKPGDHIYSWRHTYIYAHHGIYVGDGKVIHFTRAAGQETGTGTVLDKVIFSSSPALTSDHPCPVCGDQSQLSGVISSCIECFLAGGDVYLFEYGVSALYFLVKARGGTCTLAKSDSPELVLPRASYLLENGFGAYDMFKNNCEDFAIYCKTGLLVIADLSTGRSGQASSFSAAVKVFPILLQRFTNRFSVLAVVGYGRYCYNRLVSDIGYRQDAAKVPVESVASNAAREGTTELAKEVIEDNASLVSHAGGEGLNC